MLPESDTAEPLVALETAYNVFNAHRTLADARTTGIRVARLGGAVQVLDPVRPTRLSCNRVFALRGDHASLVPALVEQFDSIGTLGRFDVDDACAHSPLTEALAQAGFSPGERIVWLSRVPHDPAEPPGAPAVRQWHQERSMGFLQLLQQAEGEVHPDICALRASYYCTPTFRTWVATIDGHPASWGTTFVHGSHGLLGNATTLPPWRRRGAHQATLRARLRDAHTLGLERVFIDVGEGGESLQNCLRAGFEVVTRRTFWGRGTGG